MKLFFDETQLAHQPRQYMVHGRIVDPFENPNRAPTIIAALEGAGLERASPADFGRAPILAVHADHYVAFLEEAYARFMELPNHGPEVLPNVHPYRGASVGYGDRGKPRVTGIIGRAGWYMGDLSCATMEGTFRAAYASAQTAIAGAEEVLSGSPAAFSLCRPPGHHAYTDRCSGFCYVNDSRRLPLRCCATGGSGASRLSISTRTTATARSRSSTRVAMSSMGRCTRTRRPTIPTSRAIPTRPARARAKART